MSADDIDTAVRKILGSLGATWEDPETVVSELVSLITREKAAAYVDGYKIGYKEGSPAGATAMAEKAVYQENGLLWPDKMYEKFDQALAEMTGKGEK